MPESRMTRGRVDAWGCVGTCCFVQAVFWIPDSKCLSGTYRKLRIDIKLTPELEEHSLLMLYPFSAVVTMEKNKDRVGKPCSKG